MQPLTEQQTQRVWSRVMSAQAVRDKLKLVKR